MESGRDVVEFSFIHSLFICKFYYYLIAGFIFVYCGKEDTLFYCTEKSPISPETKAVSVAIRELMLAGADAGQIILVHHIVSSLPKNSICSGLCLWIF
jgi:hypothetical protein